MDFLEKQFLVCRTCLKMNDSCEYYQLNDNTRSFEGVSLRSMLEKCMPEMDLDLNDQSVICNACCEMLRISFIFKMKCFKTEERLYLYLDVNNLMYGFKVNLCDIADMSEKSSKVSEKNEIKLESDVEYFEAESTKKKRNSETISIIVSSDSDNNMDSVKTNSDNTENKSSDNSMESFKTNSNNTENKSLKDDNHIIYLKRDFSCDKCEYKSYRVDLLRKHLRHNCKNKGKPQKTFQCYSCSYSTIRKRNLVRHQMTHSGFRPYVCSICEKGYTEGYQLKAHMYKHSGKSLPFKCYQCSAGFARKCDLNVHVTSHINYKPFVCGTCKKGFFRKNLYKEHVCKKIK